MIDPNSQEFKKFATKHQGISSMHLDNYIESSLTPYIIEERQMNATQLDVFSRLMMDRIIFLGTGINDQVANIIQAQLLFLESTDSDKDIQIYLNSPGGSVYAGLGIYDTMQYIRPAVSSVCIGQAASMGSLLLAAGAILSSIWFIWALFALFGGLHHPPPLDDISGLDRPRKIIGLLTIVLFVLIITPVPFR